jgi:hypothetical protein
MGLRGCPGSLEVRTHNMAANLTISVLCAGENLLQTTIMEALHRPPVPTHPNTVGAGPSPPRSKSRGRPPTLFATPVLHTAYCVVFHLAKSTGIMGSKLKPHRARPSSRRCWRRSILFFFKTPEPPPLHSSSTFTAQPGRRRRRRHLVRSLPRPDD